VAAHRGRKAEIPGETLPPETGNAPAVTFALAKEEKRKSNTPKAPKGAKADRFAEFWLTWPVSVRKHDKAKCEEVWRTQSLDASADAILEDVRLKRGSPKWTSRAQDGNDFIEEPLRYLRNRRWEDGAEAVSGAATLMAGAV
jgi:hypothetical protein